MQFFNRAACFALLVVALMYAGGTNSSIAEKPSRASKPEPREVEFFAAIESGDIEVRIVPKNSSKGKALITNKTTKPLSIKLPEAFAGVPVAAQFGGLGGGGLGGGGLGGGLGGGGGLGVGGNQSVGGGFGGGGVGGGGGFGAGGGGGGFGGGGLFQVEPGKVGKIALHTICLEHGKPDPNPHIRYELKPIDTYTKDPALVELVKLFARGEIDQPSAQAGAWHLSDGLSWQQLAAKIGVKHLNGQTESYFAIAQVERGALFVAEAKRRACSHSSNERAAESQ